MGNPVPPTVEHSVSSQRFLVGSHSPERTQLSTGRPHPGVVLVLLDVQYKWNIDIQLPKDDYCERVLLVSRISSS